MRTFAHSKLPVGQPHFTPPALANAMGFHPATVARWCRQGLLQAWRSPGGRWQIAAETARAILARPAKMAVPQ